MTTGKASHMAHDPRLYSRVDVLEHTVGEVRSVLTDFAKEVRAWMQQQQAAPRPIPFKEIIVTMSATLALAWGVIEFLDGRTQSAMAVSQYRIEQLEKMSSGPACSRPQ